MTRLDSNIKEDARLVGEFLLLDTESSSMSLIVDVRKVTGGGALTDTAELVVDGTVAQADPTLVRS